MMDLSKMTDEELHAIAGQSSDTANLSHLSDDELMAIAGPEPVQEIKPSVQIPMEAKQGDRNGLAQEYGPAIIGGIANAGANLVQGTLDTPTFILEHLHAISPDTAKKLYNTTKEITDVVRSDPNGPQDDIFNTAASQHPIINKATETAANIGMITGLASKIPAIGKAGSQLGSLLSNGNKIAEVLGGVSSRALANGLISQGAVDPSAKLSALTLGAAVSPAIDLAGAGIASLGAKTTAIDEINNAISSANSSKVKQAYNEIKNLDFTPADQGAAHTVARKIEDVVTSPSSTLTPHQGNILIDYAKQLDKASSHSDVLKVLQSLGGKQAVFSGVNVTDDIYNAVNGIKTDIKSILNVAAENAGIQGAVDTASALARQNKVMTKIFGTMESNPNTFNFGSAGKTLAKDINRLEKIPEMAPAVDALKGTQKVVNEINGMFKVNQLTAQSGQAIGGGAIGGYQGYQQGGVSGAIAGGVIGTLAGPLAIHLLGKFAQSSTGLTVLRNLNKPGTTQQDINALARSILIGGITKSVQPHNSEEK